MKRANELNRTSAEALDDGLDAIWDAMNGCIDRDLKVDGIMPGGLKVKRRARHPWPPMRNGAATGPIRFSPTTG